MSVVPTTRAIRLPLASRTSWVGDPARLVLPVGERAVVLGRQVLHEVPPRETLSACMPRQIARIGSPWRSAARMSASSNTSISRSVGPSAGCGSAP